MSSDQAVKDFSVSSDQQRIQSNKDPELQNFEFYLNENDKYEIFAFFKFKIKDLIDPTLWSQISHNQEIPQEKHQLEFLDEGHQDFEKYIKEKEFTFKLLDNDIKFSVIFRPQKVYPREQHISLCVNYFIDILNEDKCNFNGIIDIYSRGFCNNIREKLIQKKKQFYVSSKCQQYSLDIAQKLYPSQDDEILWEIRFEPQGVISQEEGLPIGLVNLGVTCYMNSYLQTMFHLKKFRKYVANLDNENKEENFVFALQSLFYQMQTLKDAPAKTHQLVKSFNWDLSQIFTQQDVQEFSFMFFEAIEQKSKQQGIKQDIIKEILEGKMESFIKCLNVDYISKREEIFTDLQLVIKNQNNIYQALSTHFQSFKLEGENAYQTEQFGKQDAEKGLRFKTLPQVLTFQLNRFEYQYEYEQNVKIKDKFEFYENLDLQQYCDDTTQHYKYKLFAVNSHIGLNTNSGHYKAFINVDKQWIEFDDDQVTKVNFEYVKQNSFGGKFKDVCLDTRNFGLKSKKRQAHGHAYRLVYVQENKYDEIVNNNGQQIVFSENIQQKNKEAIKDLEELYQKREYFDLIFTFKKDFVNKNTGLNGLFCKKYHRDNFQNYLNKENLVKLQLKKTINKRNFFAIIEKTFDLENNCSDEETQSESEINFDSKMSKFYSLYIYKEKFGCLQLFDFENFIQQFEECVNEYYFYIDKHDQQLVDEKLIVIKNFDLQSLQYTVEDVFSLDDQSTMQSVLDRLDLKEPYLCKRQQYQNKYQDVDENQQISTTNASSEVIIILVRNAEDSDWQIFDKFYRNMYFQVLIDLYYEQRREKFMFRMDLTLQELIKRIKQTLKIPQEEQIMINYMRKQQSNKSSVREDQITQEENSGFLTNALFKNPFLDIRKLSDEDNQKTRFFLFIFSFKGLQLINIGKKFDELQNVNDIVFQIYDNDQVIQHMQLLKLTVEQIGLEILEQSICEIKQNGCFSLPQILDKNRQYYLVVVPTFRHVESNSSHLVVLQQYEDGLIAKQFPSLKIYLPNFTKQQFIEFLQNFFRIFQLFGEREQDSSYVISENVQRFQYRKSISEVFVLGKTEDQNLEQMMGQNDKLILEVYFYMRQKQQKNGLKINIQLYYTISSIKDNFFAQFKTSKKSQQNETKV